MNVLNKTKMMAALLALLCAYSGTSLLTGCSSGNNKPTAADSTAANAMLGAGSTFVYPLFSKMFAEYNKQTAIEVNYQSIGSGGGIQQVISKTVDFGGSDAPLNDDQTQRAGVAVLHIPIAAGADVVSYNIPGVKDTLHLTPDVIANIFLGKIKMWNDNAITSINQGVKLPAMPIEVVHRSDGSGTTYVWTDYLSKISDEWKSKVGKSTSVNWPVGIGGKGNEGVSGQIQQTPGSIGYIELAYAFKNNIPTAYIKNKSGNYIYPTLNSITAAGNITLPADAKVSITNTDAPDGYPVSSFTWALIYKEQGYNNRTEQKATALVKLFWWCTHDGQQYCKPLIYAPLSQSAVSVAENILKSATYNGKPILQQ